MKRTFKYRLQANKATLEKADNWIMLCRYLYNAALEERIGAWRHGRHSLSEYGQAHELVELKQALPEYKQVNAQVLKDVIYRLDKTYKSFFRRVKSGENPGFPRFKGRNRYHSFTLKVTGNPNGWKLDGKYLHVTNIGIFKMFYDRPIQGNIKTVTIIKSTIGYWFVCFSCDNVPTTPPSPTGKEIGIDVGLEAFAVDSEGHKVENPKYLRQAEAILRRAQRRLSRRKKGSNRRKKARILVAKAHEHIRNQRLDFLHKTANYYVANYDRIYVEDLNVKGMVRNHYLAKSISDASWGVFFNYLSYKAESAGREVIRVNPNGTSQICSGCHEKVDKSLAVRIHCCPYCGLVMDRDENAARNILGGGTAFRRESRALVHA